ncbi:hypothetical protein DPX39_030056500 [Trypanosoma brucei equiperdum]|uniref:Uncharacterized protein n=1 Tax=Trypanosoma brucei equiperdum TaxID=630700 RepID=A0A3L6LF04_9TRYP|nr:hypothetical protein DPX39_030056500 [Trypanosoma brucei equiperdum]
MFTHVEDHTDASQHPENRRFRRFSFSPGQSVTVRLPQFLRRDARKHLISPALEDAPDSDIAMRCVQHSAMGVCSLNELVRALPQFTDNSDKCTVSLNV